MAATQRDVSGFPLVALGLGVDQDPRLAEDGMLLSCSTSGFVAKALARLRDGHVAGLLSAGTYEQRVASALRTDDPGELHALTEDLPGLGDTVRGALLLHAIPDVALPVLLPDLADPPVCIGRSRTCTVTIDDSVVSRRHLELRAVDGMRWAAVDLGSSNGTTHLGRTFTRGVVLADDFLSLGGAPIRLVAPQQLCPSRRPCASDPFDRYRGHPRRRNAASVESKSARCSCVRGDAVCDFATPQKVGKRLATRR